MDVAGLTEEVREAVETLRCPICLSILRDGGEARCPACRARLRSRKRPIVLGGNNRTPARPLLLVERELEARIEAETAANYRQRRRAAKVARRIAALPPTLFEGEGAVQAETWTPQPAPAAQIIVDLPAEAIHEVESPQWVADQPAEPVVEPTPRAPKSRLLRRSTSAARRGEAAPPVREPATVEEFVALAPEPVVEAAPVEEFVALAPEPVVEAATVEEFVALAPEPVVEAATVEEFVALAPEPVVEAAPVEPEAEPQTDTREAVRIVEPVADPTPVATASWQRPNSAWINRVFNSAQRVGQAETVTWPRPRAPLAPTVDIEPETIAGEIGEAAN